MGRHWLVAGVLAVGAVGCGGPAAAYAGNWRRVVGTDPANAATLGIDAFGRLSLSVPVGDSATTMSGRGTFRADTLVFPADSSGAECQRTEARYLLARDTASNALTITAEVPDPCPGRAAALPGRWTRVVR